MSGAGLTIWSRGSLEMQQLVSYWGQEWRALLGELRDRLASALPIPAVIAERQPIFSEASDEICKLRPVAPELSLRGALPPVGSRIALVLPQIDVLRPRLRLPIAPRRVLEKALVFELARVSPVDPSDVYFDFHISKAEDRSADVSLRVVHKRLVDTAVAMCSEASLSVAEIRFGGELRPADWRRFPINRNSLVSAQWQRWRVFALSALTLVLGILLVAASYFRGNLVLTDLQRQITSAQPRARQIDRLRSEISSAAQIPSVLSLQKGQSSTVAILAEVTQILPDDTWLTALEISNRKLRLQGYSRSASHLLPRLNNSHLFADARFEAPLTQDTAGAQQRFDVVAEIVR
jgi:general secretion pathway protein L